MIRRPLPRYTETLRQRIYNYFDRDDIGTGLNGRVLAALVIVFLGLALVTPVAMLLSYLFGDPATTEAAIGNEFLYAVMRELVRVFLALTAFTAALNGGILALYAIYRMPAGDARARVMTAFNLANPVQVVLENGKLDPKELEKASNLAGGPLKLWVAANAAVLTEKKGEQRRVLGAGSHLLENFERVVSAVDLRAQAAKRETCAQTKDGIPIRADGEVEFRIKGGKPRFSAGLPFQDVVRFAWQEWVIAYYRYRGMAQRAQGLQDALEDQVKKKLEFTAPARAQAQPPYAFDDRAVVRAIYAQRLVRDKSGAVRPDTWTENVAQMAMAQLAEVLNEFTLDRITEPEDAPPDQTLPIDQTPRSEIQREVSGRIQAPAEEQGCIPIRFSLGNVQLDSTHVDADLSRQVEEQRHATWSAQWTQRARMAHSNSAIEAARRRETVRAQLQGQTIRRLVSGLPDDLEQGLVRQMFVSFALEYIEAARREPWAAQMFDREVLDAMDRLRELVF